VVAQPGQRGDLVGEPELLTAGRPLPQPDRPPVQPGPQRLGATGPLHGRLVQLGPGRVELLLDHGPLLDGALVRR
jgi:hypothetical protein